MTLRYLTQETRALERWCDDIGGRYEEAENGFEDGQSLGSARCTFTDGERGPASQITITEESVGFEDPKGLLMVEGSDGHSEIRVNPTRETFFGENPNTFYDGDQLNLMVTNRSGKREQMFIDLSEDDVMKGPPSNKRTAPDRPF